jgi:hypothetical protein
MAKIVWSANHSTQQIYRHGVELALCSDANHQIGTFVFCKDFFQDAILAFLHNVTCDIYGYSYEPRSMPAIPQNNLKVLITNASDPVLAERIGSLEEFLHQIENKLGVACTVVERCEDVPEKYTKCGIYLLTADPIWMHAPPLLSLWTLLARNGLMHTKGDKWEMTIQNIIDGKVKAAQAYDNIYVKFGKPGLDLLLEKGVEALFGKVMKHNYPLEQAGNVMHHYSGCVSWGSGKAKPYFKHWQYPAVETSPPSVCFA